MMLIALSPLAIALVLCLGLNSRISTRLLGMLSALATLAAGGILLAERLRPVESDLLLLIWATLDQMVVFVPTQLDPLSHTLAIVVLGGGGFALWSLALALDPSIRGFGTLFAWGIFALVATLLGLAGSGVFIPFAWGIAVLASYGTVRASRALVQYQSAPTGLIMGMLATLLLTVGIISLQAGFFASQAPGVVGISVVIMACLMLAGSVPFHHTLDEVVEAPAALSGMLAGLVLPILAMATLYRVLWTPNAVFASLPLTMPDFWRTPLLLLATVSMIISAGAALREYRLRRIIGWQMSVQIALVLVAISTTGPMAGMAAGALLVNAALSTLVASLAASILEHVTGSDDCTQDVAGKPGVARVLRVPGLVWGFAALSALGLPPFWGFWGRYWLVDSIKDQAPWSIPLLLAASSIAALGYLVPMAQFWRAARPQRGQQQDSGRVAVQGSMLLQDSGKKGDTGGLKVQSGGGGMQVKEKSTTTRLPHYLSPMAYLVLPILALLPLVLLGLKPQTASQAWFVLLPTGGEPFVPTSTMQIGMGVLTIGLVLVVTLGAQLRWKRRTLTDEDMVPIALTPDTLANSLFPLVWAGRPTSLLRGMWNVLLLVNRGVQLVLSPFEQRYYLAGVLLALISLIVFMAQ